jgi:transcriptional regulator with XRE-family HTH domain
VKILDDNKDMITEGMSERIAARRKQLGLTQEQTAEIAGLSHQFFSSVEGNRKNIRAENVVKLANALRVSTDYILTGHVNNVDVDYVTSMLRELDAEQLHCAEEIIKNLLIACKRTK